MSEPSQSAEDAGLISQVMQQSRGAGLILIAGAFVAASTLCAKALGQGEGGMNALQITWGRFFFALMGLLIVIKFVKPKFTSPKWSLHAVRVVCGVAGVTLMFAAAAIIPLGDVTAISFTNPIFTMILAIPLLGERIGPIRWGTALLAFTGALMLIRPGSEGFQPASLLALCAALLFGLELIMLKKLSGREGAFQIILIANVVGVALLSIPAFLVWQQPNAMQWTLLAGTGIFMVTAQTCYTNGLRMGDASFVLPFSYSTLLFAALYDFLLFDVIPVPFSIAGGIIIIISGILLAWREAVANKVKG